MRKSVNAILEGLHTSVSEASTQMKKADAKNLISSVKIGQVFKVRDFSYIRLDFKTFGEINKKGNLVDNSGMDSTGRYSQIGENEMISIIQYQTKTYNAKVEVSDTVLDAKDLIKRALSKSGL